MDSFTETNKIEQSDSQTETVKIERMDSQTETAQILKIESETETDKIEKKDSEILVKSDKPENTESSTQIEWKHTNNIGIQTLVEDEPKKAKTKGSKEGDNKIEYESIQNDIFKIIAESKIEKTQHNELKEKYAQLEKEMKDLEEELVGEFQIKYDEMARSK